MMVLRSSHVCRWNSSSVDARTARSMSVRLNGGGSSTPPWDATMFSGQERTIGVFWEGLMHEAKSGSVFGCPGGLGCWMRKEARVPADCWILSLQSALRDQRRGLYIRSPHAQPQYKKFRNSSLHLSVRLLSNLDFFAGSEIPPLKL
jgi:hypothetical protein